MVRARHAGERLVSEAAAARDGAVSQAERIALRTWPGARVERAAMLAGDASARRYARLHLAGGGAPATAIAMLLPEGDALASEELAPDAGPPPELPFVSVGRFLEANGIPVPAVYATAVAAGVLLLEDVGDLPLAEAALAGDPEPPLDAAVEVLARIAALVDRREPTCPALAARYDRVLIGRELEVVHAYGLAASASGPPRQPGSDPEVERALGRLGDAIAAQPLVLMHRDFHAWNLHLDRRGRVRVIDYQDAVLGPALYDLATLCTDRDSDRFVSPALEATLVRRFAARLAAAGGPDLGSPDEVRRRYFEAVAYRTLRVIGRFRFLAMEKGKPGYLRFLPRMARQTRRALDATGDRKLRDALASRSEAFA
jgi:aminoglycoside/choline kinase family phosphotransferase